MPEFVTVSVYESVPPRVTAPGPDFATETGVVVAPPVDEDELEELLLLDEELELELLEEVEELLELEVEEDELDVEELELESLEEEEELELDGPAPGQVTAVWAVAALSPGFASLLEVIVARLVTEVSTHWTTVCVAKCIAICVCPTATVCRVQRTVVPATRTQRLSPPTYWRPEGTSSWTTTFRASPGPAFVTVIV